MDNQKQDTLVSSANSTNARVSEKTVTSSGRGGDDDTVSDKLVSADQEQKEGDRKQQPWQHPWDDSESELLMGLRAQKFSWSKIREYFPDWSTRDLSKESSRLKKEPQWTAVYEAVLQMEVSEQVTFVDRAKSAVTHYRSQRALEKNQEENSEAAEDEAAEYGAIGAEALNASPVDADYMNGDVLETTGPSAKKRRSDGRQSKRKRYPWDDNESELLIALRARGFSYNKLRERDFSCWSFCGIRNKLIKIRGFERWEARFQAILRMNGTEQLATIASAQAAVAHSRRRRAQAEQEGADKADAASNVATQETAITGSLERASAEAADEATTDEPSDSCHMGVDAYEIPESPDPEMGRTAPAEIPDKMSLAEGEDHDVNSRNNVSCPAP